MSTPNRNTQPLDGTGDTATGAAWLSVVDAAALLGVSARAVQKRAERGTLPARRVAHGRAMRWEIDGQKLDENAGANGSQDVRKMGAKRSLDGRDGANSERVSVRKTGANGSQDVRATDGDLTARLLAQLETENAFLRATVEQLHRDGAETRAALRAALKLTGETSAPKLTAKPETSAPDVASDATAMPEPPAPDRRKSATATAKEPGAPLTYNDIADALERDLAARSI